MNQELSPEKAWGLAMIGALIAILAVVLYDVLAPKPKLETSVSAQNKYAATVNAEIKKLQKDLDDKNAMIGRSVWTGNASEIGPEALSTLTKFIVKEQLKLISSRPERTATDFGLNRYPYIVTLEGPYPKVLDFVREVETPDSKLAVNLVQLASADGSSDRVTASIGVVAYQVAPASPGGSNGSTKKS